MRPAKTIRDPASRDRIVAAASALVARQGVHASTMRGIAQEAGVSTGAVTHYFEDKADVMGAVLRQNTQLIARRIVEAVDGRRGLAALEAAMEALLPIDEEMLHCWTVNMAFWGHGPARQFLASEDDERYGYRGLRSFVTAILRDAAEDGEIAGNSDAEHEADRILALVGGIGLTVGGFRRRSDETRQRARIMLAEHIASMKRA